ncbi:MAG TPA: HAMP domain-containing sensor histidine kinase [Opitutaceae bacterium]|nr:HAMP domain-containing sensor histidine kinase [Opitutaceae bacterium]
MFDRLRQSLALRLAVQYALVFALSAAVLFGILYWDLARALEAREQAALHQRVEDFAGAFARGGGPAMIAQINNDSSPDLPALFVRLTTPDNLIVYNKWPRDWIETEVRQLLPGISIKRDVLRIPQTAERDYTIVSHEFPDGWTLYVGRLMDSQRVLLAPLRRAFAFAGAGALVLAIFAGTGLAWRATRPLREVSLTARRILETGDLAARVPGSEGRGELAVLVRQLNTLLDRNAAHVRVLRETLDNLAHDLRTPLTRLRGTAELALHDGGDPAQARDALADCVDESDRVLHLLEALLDISAAEAGALKLNRDALDLRSLVERAADLYREVAEEKHIAILLDQPAPVELRADAIRLGQAINNLLDNALKYTPASGRVSLATRMEGGAAILTVTDNGRGVPLAEREAIFRRLYRGDASRSQRGLGLGLSLVKAIVEAHGGSVAVDDAPGGGARFTLRLPR